MTTPAPAPTTANNNQQQQQPSSTSPANATPASNVISNGTHGIIGPSASLYVGDLEPSVTEALLFELFNNIGAVQSIRVCKDAATRRSLGYAYVNFHNVSDGEKALEALNYYSVKGKPIRIMWSHRDPALRRSGAGNIFIKNLDLEIDNKALHDTFAAFGNILSCKVAQDETGASKGYAFVHYETHAAAEAAIKGVNGMLLNDKKVYVGFHIPKKERLAKAEDQRAKFTNVFIKNLEETVTEDQLRAIFQQFGHITSLLIQRNDDGSSRGFAFINYSNYDEANKAVDNMNEKDINGKQLYVCRAQKKAEREDELRRQYERAREEKSNKYQGVNLYVKNLDDSIDDEKLRQEFSVYGIITSAKVMREEKPALGDMPPTSISKGFGFVCFSSQDEATKAVTEMNNKLIAGKPIYVALAQRKEARKQQLAQQMAQRAQMRPTMVPGMPGMAPYPGQPMFYPPQPGMPPQPRGLYFPQQMMPRPRYGNMPQNGPPMAPAGYPMGPGMPQHPPAMNGMPMGGYPHPQPRPGQHAPAMAGIPMGGYPHQQPRPGQHPPAMAGMPMGGYPHPQPRPGPGAPPGRGRPQAPYKFSTNARNAPMGVPQGGQMAPYSSQVPRVQPLNAATLASLPPEAQKRMVGESLFPLVQGLASSQPGKITGMLLEMDNSELLHLLEDNNALELKVREAVSVLEVHRSKEPVPDLV